jgi:polyphenol oxidase
MAANRTETEPPSLEGRRGKDQIDVVRVAAMSAIPWLLHGFSTRRGGVSTAYCESRGELNLGFTDADKRENVEANRQLFLEAVTGGPRFPLATVRQIHSAIVKVFKSGDAEMDFGLLQADGMMTDRPSVLLGIQTADCIPVLVADRKRRAVAAFHAGWRGTAKRIVEDGLGRMRTEFGSEPEDLLAAIGPGIGQCCYRVGDEVRAEFDSQFSYASEVFGERPLLPDHGAGLYVDLMEANRRQLLDAGLSASAISVVSECTSCRTDRYFSYRAERGATGRMLSVIGVKPD